MGKKENTGVVALKSVIPEMIAELCKYKELEDVRNSFADRFAGTNIISASFDIRPTEKTIDMESIGKVLTGIMTRVFTRSFSPNFGTLSYTDGRVYRIRVSFVYNDYSGSPQYIG